MDLVVREVRNFNDHCTSRNIFETRLKSCWFKNGNNYIENIKSFE